MSPEQELREIKAKVARLEKIEAAARNLIKVRGRFHTEAAYHRLERELAEDKLETSLELPQ